MSRNASSPRYLVLMGPPGSGKGTQAQGLSQALGLPHIASGDLFREHLARKTELGRLAAEYMEKGELVPDAVTIRMVLERLKEPDAAGGAILDGFPRTVEQARALDEALAAEGQEVERAINLDVPQEELLRRLSGRWICRNCQASYHEVSAPPKVPGVCDRCGGPLYQREDDTRETALRRLEVYERQTLPLLDYYRQQGKLVEVNGTGTIEEVGAALREAAARELTGLRRGPSAERA